MNANIIYILGSTLGKGKGRAIIKNDGPETMQAGSVIPMRFAIAESTGKIGHPTSNKGSIEKMDDNLYCLFLDSDLEKYEEISIDFNVAATIAKDKTVTIDIEILNQSSEETETETDDSKYWWYSKPTV